MLAAELLNLIADSDDIADRHRERWAVDLLAIDLHVTVNDELTRAPHGAGETRAADDVVQAQLEELHHHFAGVALATTSFFEVATELLLEHVVMEANLLLLILADSVVLETTATETMHTWRGELALRGVLWDVHDRDTNLARELHLRTEIARHGTSSFLQEAYSGAVVRTVQAVRANLGDAHAPSTPLGGKEE